MIIESFMISWIFTHIPFKLLKYFIPSVIGALVVSVSVSDFKKQIVTSRSISQSVKINKKEHIKLESTKNFLK